MGKKTIIFFLVSVSAYLIKEDFQSYGYEIVYVFVSLLTLPLGKMVDPSQESFSQPSPLAKVFFAKKTILTRRRKA